MNTMLLAERSAQRIETWRRSREQFFKPFLVGGGRDYHVDDGEEDGDTGGIICWDGNDNIVESVDDLMTVMVMTCSQVYFDDNVMKWGGWWW